MTISRKNKKGKIEISKSAIASLVSSTVAECYGVQGLVSKKDIKSREYFNNGVGIKEMGQALTIDIFCVVSYGVKITEIASEVQKRVRYVLKKALDIERATINVYVQSTKEIA